MADRVLVRRAGRLGRITLNRPEAINALTLPMIRSMAGALVGWGQDPTIELVVIDGAGERGFCAGGDIRAVYESARASDGFAEILWREEYELDAYLARFPKPVISILDGITMGGGMGLGCHVPVRIATERSSLAMPEVKIGLAPDVAGTLLLARAPGHVGEHLALTGGRVGPADALYCNLVDHVIPSSRVGELVHRLEDEPLSDVLGDLELTPGESQLVRDRLWIDECYGAGTVDEIVGRLEAHDSHGARSAARQIRLTSPLASKVTLRAMHETRRSNSIEEVLVQDFRVTTRFLQVPDLVEGIRAAIVDKDRRPRWSPSSLEMVTSEMVDRHFAPLGDQDLRLRV
jgi:enoyl-CoA hydratase